MCPADHETPQPLLLPALDETRSHIRTSPVHHPTRPRTTAQLLERPRNVRLNFEDTQEHQVHFLMLRVLLLECSDNTAALRQQGLQRHDNEIPRPRRHLHIHSGHRTNQSIEIRLRLLLNPTTAPRRAPAQERLEPLRVPHRRKNNEILIRRLRDQDLNLCLRDRQIRRIHTPLPAVPVRGSDPLSQPPRELAAQITATPGHLRRNLTRPFEHPPRTAHNTGRALERRRSREAEHIHQQIRQRGTNLGKRCNTRVHTRILHMPHHTRKRTEQKLSQREDSLVSGSEPAEQRTRDTCPRARLPPEGSALTAGWERAAHAPRPPPRKRP